MLPGVEPVNTPQRILILLPSEGFDPTEVAVPWRYLNQAGHITVFATPNGIMGQADPYMVTGVGLKFMSALRADVNGREAYEDLRNTEAFRNPVRYDAIRPGEYDALLLPGGNAPGVVPYLDSNLLQNIVVDFFRRGAPVAAIGQGVLLAARSRDAGTNGSVLAGRKTAGLSKAQTESVFHMTRLVVVPYNHYQQEVPPEIELKTFLTNPTDFLPGPTIFSRDSPTSVNNGFVVRDNNYLSGRWAGDAHKLGNEFLKLLDELKGLRGAEQQQATQNQLAQAAQWPGAEDYSYDPKEFYA